MRHALCVFLVAYDVERRVLHGLRHCFPDLGHGRPRRSCNICREIRHMWYVDFGYHQSVSGSQGEYVEYGDDLIRLVQDSGW